MNHEQLNELMPLKDYVDARGKPTAKGRVVLEFMRFEIDRVLAPEHDDNCGPGCRVDLDGHDCCYTCNLVEALLRGAIREEGLLPTPGFDE